MSGTKIGQFRRPAQAKGEEPRKTAYDAMVKDQEGNVLDPKVKISLLHRFSGAAREQVTIRQSIKVSETATFTVPKLGEQTPHPVASTHILRWMEFQSDTDKLLEICPDAHQHTPSQLIQITAAAYAYVLLPRGARDELSNKAIDAIVNLATAGELTAAIVVLAVKLFPAEDYVVLKLMRRLATIYVNDIADSEHIEKAMWEAVAQLPVVDDLFGAAIYKAELDKHNKAVKAYWKGRRADKKAGKQSRRDAEVVKGEGEESQSASKQVVEPKGTKSQHQKGSASKATVEEVSAEKK